MPSGGIHRRAGGGTRPRQRSRHRAEDRVGGLPVRVRAGRAEVGDRHRHEVSEPVGQLFSTEVPNACAPPGWPPSMRMSASRARLMNRPRSVALSASRIDAALAGVVQRERHSGPRYRRACDAVRRAAWQFDLQDVGAEVAEQPAHRVAVSAADVQYPQRRQGPMRPSRMVKHSRRHRDRRATAHQPGAQGDRPKAVVW